MKMTMTSDGTGDVVTWELTIFVTDLKVERSIRVTGDLSVGGVMLKLVDALDIAVDWSDHALYWPEKCFWLSRTRYTLDQYHVQSDNLLWFTPMHKCLRVMLPDLQIIPLLINFSVNVFSVVIKVCKELGIRNPEELSFSRKMNGEELKKNKSQSSARRRTQLLWREGGGGAYGMANGHLSSRCYDDCPYKLLQSTSTLQGSSTVHNQRLDPFVCSADGGEGGGGGEEKQLNALAGGTISPGSAHSLSFDGAIGRTTLINSPMVLARDALCHLHRPNNFSEKARINAGWLDSSRSLMEQGMEENDIILLRFKFLSFYDLNPKYDAIRINQIYEQAKWSLISEELDCTEEEMIVFAAIQLQIQKQILLPQPSNLSQSEDDIDAALNDLQVSLEGTTVSSSTDITRTPELNDYLRFFKPKKFAFKSFKRCYCIFRDTHLSMFKSSQDVDEQQTTVKFDLKGCEVTSDINISTQKFIIKLFIPTSTGMIEIWLREDTEDQYARWMAAFKLAAKERTMADSSYESEVKAILAFMNMQHPVIPTPHIDDFHFDPEDYVASRFLNLAKGGRQIVRSILEAHANVSNLNLMEAKLSYIKAWQSLAEYGLTYFIIKLKGCKKEELLAVAFNRMIRMDLQKGDSLKTWRYQDLKSWSVNWEIKQVQVTFEDEEVAFQCLTCDCKVVHEFIGGYIFLSMRSSNRNQSLNEELFHKLTGGWL